MRNVSSEQIRLLNIFMRRKQWIDITKNQDAMENCDTRISHAKNAEKRKFLWERNLSVSGMENTIAQIVCTILMLMKCEKSGRNYKKW